MDSLVDLVLLYKHVLVRYNAIVDECFNRCVISMGETCLKREEVFCVDTCFSKNIEFSRQAMKFLLASQKQHLSKGKLTQTLMQKKTINREAKLDTHVVKELSEIFARKSVLC